MKALLSGFYPTFCSFFVFFLPIVSASSLDKQSCRWRTQEVSNSSEVEATRPRPGFLGSKERDYVSLAF
jgi:hypothetical protein